MPWLSTPRRFDSTSVSATSRASAAARPSFSRQAAANPVSFAAETDVSAMDRWAMSALEDSLAGFRAWGRAALFASAAAAAALSLSAYTARTRALAMRHIYFTAWHVLPGFTLFMALLSMVVIRV